MSDRPSAEQALAVAEVAAIDPVEPWRELTAQIGREVAEPLSAALERVIRLMATGRIDRGALRLLRGEIEQARRVGIASQQLSRFTSKRLRQSHERLNLANALQAALTYRQRELASRGIHVKQSTRAIEVLVDPPLLFSLLNAVLDWSVESARSTIDLRVDMKSWPVHARLSCRFAHAGADDAARDSPDTVKEALSSLNWHLIHQIARTMELELHREDDATHAKVVIEFPRTVNEELEGMSAIELDHGGTSSLNSKPLAGSHVLVVAARREVRVQVRDAICHMGLVLDFVGSIDEAVDFCKDGLPHAIIFEAVLRGARLDQLAEEIRDEVPEFSFIEIVEEGNAFEISGFNGMSYARIGREGLHHALPSALVFELSKSY